MQGSLAEQVSVRASFLTPARFIVALAAVAAAVALAYALQDVIEPSVVLLLGVVFVSWVSGLWPALIASVLATLALNYFFMLPLYTVGIELRHVPHLLVFMLIASGFVAISAARRRAERLLKQAHDNLDAKVRERTAALLSANEQLTAQYAISREQADLLDLTHDTIFVRDGNDVIRYWNHGAAELYGWSPEEAIGRVSHDLTRTVFPAPLDEINAQLLATGRWDGELVHTKRDGSRVVVASRWSLRRNADGTPIGILETNNDVTDRRRAEAELRESERRHRHIFHATSTSIWEEDFTAVKAAIDEVTRNGVTNLRDYLETHPEFVDRAMSLVRIVDVNEATLKLFGAKSKNEMAQSLANIFTPETRDAFAGELVAIAEGRTSFEGETALRKLTGERIVVLFSLSLPASEEPFDAVLVSITDITDRKRAEQQLEELAGRLIHAQEQERRRIGRELHDHISQMVGVLTIRLDQLRDEETTPAATAHALAELRQRAAEITEEIHDLSHRLHSSALDYLGLVPALQKLVKEFSARHHLAIDFAHSGVPGTLTTEMALCLFRVAEESLNNIAKHSHAKTARIELRGSDSGLRLTIEDSGRGFDVGGLERKAGLGFVSMRERLRVLRGNIHVDSAPSRGTRIDVWAPATSAPAASDDAPHVPARREPAPPA